MNAPDLQLKAIIAYENVTAGRRAIAVLHRLLSHSHEPLGLKPVLWRFDLLAAEPWSDLSLRDAADSDMIVVSTSRSDAIPTAIARWASACLARRQGASTAMLTLTGSGDAWSVWIQDEFHFHTIQQSRADAPVSGAAAEVHWPGPSLHEQPV